MRFLLDEMISPAVASRLREQGCDTVSVHDRGTRSGSDADQLADAVRSERAFVTYNIDDFVSLVVQYAEQQRDHFGVILISERAVRNSDVGGLVRALAELASLYPVADALANQCVFLKPAP